MYNLGSDLLNLLASTVALYIIVDPIGNIPLFTAVTARLDPRRRRRVLVLSVAVAALILVLFAVFGVEFFGYFGVTLGDFMVASGIILVVFSLLYLTRPYEQGVAAEGVEVAVVPLAVPFLAGPASISYVLLLSREAGLLHALLVIIVVSLLTLATLLASEVLTKILGILGIRVVEKIMLILSVAIGISLIRRGLSQWSAGPPQ
ncbi:MAG: MarC family protein [Pyrobaculum sp.]|jgi:multiple antibiotic resistance protein